MTLLSSDAAQSVVRKQLEEIAENFWVVRFVSVRTAFTSTIKYKQDSSTTTNSKGASNGKRCNQEIIGSHNH
jgi:hypothetical protein